MIHHSLKRQPAPSAKLYVGRIGPAAAATKAFGLWRNALVG